ncbi:uncharacterized protein BXIN_0615 [Babesia sp. Xinjiang]|uniref:uncharacterized protein n=1 Tax=Babesia sp. Xinjiang TaxID=462227 RepID=UPI000A227B1E|nr:uncharacterized protein BXIN_0615 [Babesia sp. Xinjiang]ORM41795.1 hypothetical protein BXIN_0615 [Babesia sp. Xinjiang]
MSSACELSSHPGEIRQGTVEEVCDVALTSVSPKPDGDTAPKVAEKAPKVSKGVVDDEELIEQDLSEEEDVLYEPFVQRYRPGVSVEVKLKTIHKETVNGVKQVPMIIDFYAECLKVYREERLFIFEDGYLGQKRDVSNDNAAKDRAKSNGSQGNNDSKPEKGPGQEHNGVVSENSRLSALNAEVSLDDVMWLKNRPNDPLLRCIQSITDRLNIQGIVGDPVSYLKAGGDDMHYDIDDPFIDDDQMFNELSLSRDELVRKKQMERDFSIWSEDEDDQENTIVQPTNFVSQYASKLKSEIENNSEQNKEVDLYFDPVGWRRYMARIPKQFHPIFHEMEATYKSYEGCLYNEDLRKLVLHLLNAILAKLIKIQAPRPKKTPTNGDPVSTDTKDPLDEQLQIFERQGLNCVGIGKILGVNGRFLRWVVAAISEVTNAVSCHDIHEEWLKLVLEYNEQTINAMRDRLAQRLIPKVQQLKDKKGEKLFNKLADNLRNLSKSVGSVRRLMRDYEVAIAEEYGLSKAGDRKSNNGENGKRIKDKPHALTEPSTPKRLAGPPAEDLNSKADIVYNGSVMSPGSAAVNSAGRSSDSMTFEAPEMDDPFTASPTQGFASDSEIMCIQQFDNGEGGVLTLEDLNTSQSDYDVPAATTDDVDSNAEPEGCSFASMIRNWSMWRRVSNMVTIYKYIAGDILTWVQMINIATATLLTIAGTDFKNLVEKAVSVPYIFDKAYMSLADLFSSVIQDISGVKVLITPDVSRIIVMYIHETSSVHDLCERENKEPLVFFNNSYIAASHGKVHLRKTKKDKPPSTPGAVPKESVPQIVSKKGREIKVKTVQDAEPEAKKPRVKSVTQ